MNLPHSRGRFFSFFPDYYPYLIMTHSSTVFLPLIFYIPAVFYLLISKMGILKFRKNIFSFLCLLLVLAVIYSCALGGAGMKEILEMEGINRKGLSIHSWIGALSLISLLFSVYLSFRKSFLNPEKMQNRILFFLIVFGGLYAFGFYSAGIIF